jgi:hypothetical protein
MIEFGWEIFDRHLAERAKARCSPEQARRDPVDLRLPPVARAFGCAQAMS